MPDEDLDSLIAAWLDGRLTPEQHGRLERRLLEDPLARRRLRDLANLDVPLRDWAVSAALGDCWKGDPQPALNSSIPGFLRTFARSAWHILSGHPLASSLTVMVVVAAVAAGIWIHRSSARPDAVQQAQEQRGPVDPVDAPGDNVANKPPSNMTAPGARLVRVHEGQWNEGVPIPRTGDSLPAGRTYGLAGGVAEIEFEIGAKVVLQSPATFELVSDKSVRLEVGKATIEVKTERARGFTVLTPLAAFVDQGTEFGVEVTADGGSKVHVFRGAVDVNRIAKAGRAAPPTQRLVQDAGARMERGEPGMTLVEDTGACFIRSIDEVDRDRHVVAYWRFEDRTVGILLPDTRGNRRPVCATEDSSFNGNDLYVAMARNRPTLSADVPAALVSQTGSANRSCLDTSSPTTEVNRLNVYTHSRFSHAAPLDLQRIAPAQWTIEASVKAAKLIGKAQGFLGRDADFTSETTRAPARLTFQITDRDRFAIGFYDVDGRRNEAVAEDLPVEAGRWYHLAATSDGRVLRLYVDCLDGRGYVEHAATELPTTGSTALGKGQDSAEWTIGRAGNAGDAAEWLRFWGWIDEVRISNIARKPAEFLFAPKGNDNAKHTLGRIDRSVHRIDK